MYSAASTLLEACLSPRDIHDPLAANDASVGVRLDARYCGLKPSRDRTMTVGLHACVPLDSVAPSGPAAGKSQIEREAITLATAASVAS